MLQYDFFPIPTKTLSGITPKSHGNLKNTIQKFQILVYFFMQNVCTFVLIPKVDTHMSYLPIFNFFFKIMYLFLVDEISFTRTNIVRITKQCVYVITHP
jgi:hypothetical protein